LRKGWASEPTIACRAPCEPCIFSFCDASHGERLDPRKFASRDGPDHQDDKKDKRGKPSNACPVHSASKRENDLLGIVNSRRGNTYDEVSRRLLSNLDLPFDVLHGVGWASDKATGGF